MYIPYYLPRNSDETIAIIRLDCTVLYVDTDLNWWHTCLEIPKRWSQLLIETGIRSIQLWSGGSPFFILTVSINSNVMVITRLELGRYRFVSWKTSSLVYQ
jgi:hypothetical protein